MIVSAAIFAIRRDVATVEPSSIEPLTVDGGESVDGTEGLTELL